jgi:hypothetical protein
VILGYKQKALLNRSGLKKRDVRPLFLEAANLRGLQSMSAWGHVMLILVLTPNIILLQEANLNTNVLDLLSGLQIILPLMIFLSACMGTLAERSLWRLVSFDADFSPFVSDFKKLRVRGQVCKWLFAVSLICLWITKQ